MVQTTMKQLYGISPRCSRGLQLVPKIAYSLYIILPISKLHFDIQLVQLGYHTYSDIQAVHLGYRTNKTNYPFSLTLLSGSG